MKDIDFSLAPADATHYYGKVDHVWRRFEGGWWYFWFDNKWRSSAGDFKNDYIQIPEYERALNWAADTYAEWPYDKYVAVTLSNYSGVVITWLYWQERRVKRIKAGLNKESNTTGTADKEDELTWLARNADPVEFQDPRTEATLVRTSDGWKCAKWVVDGYDREQWMKRRIELGLGLESEQGKPTKEWDGTGLPPVGAEFTLKPYWHKVKVVAHNEQPHGVDIVYFDYHLNQYDFSNRPDCFHPIRTTEQVEQTDADKRHKWAYTLCRITNDRFTLEEAERIYDALLSGELEPPKDGDL